jgi:ubiquitin-protein ligase
MYHPNIRHTGEVCISILHPPGDDAFEYEHRSERWLPVHTTGMEIMAITRMIMERTVVAHVNIGSLAR